MKIKKPINPKDEINIDAFRICVRSLRKEKGYTQKYLGQLIGYSSFTISQIETGHASPSFRFFTRIMDELAGTSLFDMYSRACGMNFYKYRAYREIQKFLNEEEE